MVFPFVQALGSKEIWDNAEIQLKAPLKELRNYIGEMNDDAVNRYCNLQQLFHWINKHVTFTQRLVTSC